MSYQCIEITSSWRIQTSIFPFCTSACKITQAKTKDDSAWTKKSNILRAKNSGQFLYQVNFSFLLLEVCFQLLSVTSKMIPFQNLKITPRKCSTLFNSPSRLEITIAEHFFYDGSENAAAPLQFAHFLQTLVSILLSLLATTITNMRNYSASLERCTKIQPLIVLIFHIMKRLKQSNLLDTVFICLHDTLVSTKHSHHGNCGQTTLRLAGSSEPKDAQSFLPSTNQQNAKTGHYFNILSFKLIDYYKRAKLIRHISHTLKVILIKVVLQYSLFRKSQNGL